MKHLSEFIHAFDFIHARPVAGWVSDLPKHVLCATLAVEGKDYAAYLADAQEATDPAAGSPIDGKISFPLPEGSFQVGFYSPTTGLTSPLVRIRGRDDREHRPARVSAGHRVAGDADALTERT